MALEFHVVRELLAAVRSPRPTQRGAGALGGVWGCVWLPRWKGVGRGVATGVARVVGTHLQGGLEGAHDVAPPGDTTHAKRTESHEAPFIPWVVGATTGSRADHGHDRANRLPCADEAGPPGAAGNPSRRTSFRAPSEVAASVYATITAPCRP